MPFYRDITAPSAATEYLNRFSGDYTPAYPARCWCHRPPHTARVRHINPSTAHPILSVLGSSPHAENRLPPQWSREAVLGRHTAYLRSPLRLSHPLMQAVFRGQRRLNPQDSNLRSLPLPVKRRSPPRPRFRMPPSFRGVSSVAFGAHLSIARIGRCLPHGWCDHPARICGLVFSRAAYLAVIAATDAGG